MMQAFATSVFCSDEPLKVSKAFRDFVAIAAI
jgi:hypothetical protein